MANMSVAGFRSPRIDTGHILSGILPRFSTTAIIFYSELDRLLQYGEVLAFRFLSCRRLLSNALSTQPLPVHLVLLDDLTFGLQSFYIYAI